MIDTIPYPGSKRTCVARLLPLLGVGRLLVSPFTGMAAVEVAALEAGRFKRAKLSDASPHVVAVLLAAQADPARLHAEQVSQRERIAGSADELALVQREAGEALAGGHTMEAAARILGASCWSYSRLWRVNGSGALNAPVDPRGRPAVSLPTLRRYAAALSRTDVELAAWPDALRDVSRATIYCDPPYLGAGGFVEYTAARWGTTDAESLAGRLSEMHGCRVVLSEQDPGGALLYRAKLSVVRRCTLHAFERRRNTNGKHISDLRRECTLVAPATLVLA